MPSAPSAGTDVGSFGENLSPGESDMLCITNTCTINKYKQKEEGVSEENVVIIIQNVREMRLKLHKRRSKSSSHIQQSAFFFLLCVLRWNQIEAESSVMPLLAFYIHVPPPIDGNEAMRVAIHISVQFKKQLLFPTVCQSCQFTSKTGRVKILATL